MPGRSVGLLLLLVGVASCIPAAFAVITFANATAELDAFQAAPRCATPTQDSHANCLSLFNGKITLESSAGRGTRRATVAIADSALEVDVRYPSQSSLQQGSDVVTEWWRGQLVLLGPAGASPTIRTQENPADHLQSGGFFLVVVALAVSFLLAGALMLQAPMSVDGLIKASVANWPDPPRPLPRALVWRVGLGSGVTMVAFVAWLPLFVFPEVILALNNQSRFAPWLLLAAFVVPFGLLVPVATLGLADVVRLGERRTIVVKKLTPGVGRYAHNTRIWYELKDGRLDSILLDPPWEGRVAEGDQIAVLALPKTGGISRILSTPPALAEPAPIPAS